MNKRTHAAYLAVIALLIFSLGWSLVDLKMISERVYQQGMKVERLKTEATVDFQRIRRLEFQRGEVAGELGALERRVAECGRVCKAEVDQALKSLESARMDCHAAEKETQVEIEAALKVCEGAQNG